MYLRKYIRVAKILAINSIFGGGVEKIFGGVQNHSGGGGGGVNKYSGGVRTPRTPPENPSLLKTHPLIKPSVSFGDALDSLVKRTVFMFVIMQFHDHSMQKSFLDVREGILI